MFQNVAYRPTVYITGHFSTVKNSKNIARYSASFFDRELGVALIIAYFVILGQTFSHF
jgi:hypothetical protein